MAKQKNLQSVKAIRKKTTTICGLDNNQNERRRRKWKTQDRVFYYYYYYIVFLRNILFILAVSLPLPPTMLCITVRVSDARVYQLRI